MAKSDPSEDLRIRQPPPTLSATWNPLLHWPRYRVRTSTAQPTGRRRSGPLATGSRVMSSTSVADRPALPVGPAEARRGPGLHVGAVGVHTDREFGIEDEVAGGVELREVGQGAPADDQVPAPDRLGIALRRRRQILGLIVGGHQGGHPCPLVEGHRDGPAVGELRRARRLVVEERVLVVTDRLGIVLPGEDLIGAVEDLSRAGLFGEAALLTSELPDDLPRDPVDLVGRPRVPGIDQQVPVGVEVHGVDVEPVPRRARPTPAAAARCL